MFYCGECAAITGWPDGWGDSYGRCEMCERGGQVCNDVPSSHLSIPTNEMHARIKALSPHLIQEEP